MLRIDSDIRIETQDIDKKVDSIKLKVDLHELLKELLEE